MTIAKFHFVYNVDATPVALVKDFLHRELEPETYPCTLCDITYGRFVKNKGWSKFLASLPVASDFYTRDKFMKTYPQFTGHTFPCVFAEDDKGQFSEVIAADDFSRVAGLPALQNEITTILDNQ